MCESQIDSHYDVSVPYVPIYYVFVAWDVVCGRYWLVLSVGYVLRFRWVVFGEVEGFIRVSTYNNQALMELKILYEEDFNYFS